MLSERDQLALEEVRKEHPGMTEAEYCRLRDNGLKMLRRAMINNGYPEYKTMPDDELGEYIREALSDDLA